MESSGFSSAIMILGVFVFGLGLLGFWLAKCKGTVSTTVFIVLAAVLALVLLIVGALLGGFVGNGLFNKIERKMCKKSSVVFEGYRDTVDKGMCSIDCPCTKGEGDFNKKLWTGYDTDILSASNRVAS